MQAYLGRTMRAYPETQIGLAGLSARLLLLYHPRRVVTSLVSSSLRLGLALAEWRGALAGFRRYKASERRACEIAGTYGQTITPSSPEQPRVPEPSLRRIRTVHVDLAEPLPAVLPGPDDSDRVRIAVEHGRRPLGTVTIISGGHAISRRRVGDAIVSELGNRLVDEIRDPVRAALRAAWRIPPP